MLIFTEYTWRVWPPEMASHFPTSNEVQDHEASYALKGIKERRYQCMNDGSVMDWKQHRDLKRAIL